MDGQDGGYCKAEEGGHGGEVGLAYYWVGVWRNDGQKLCLLAILIFLYS